MPSPSDELAARLASNIKHLRTTRGVTQQQMAKLSGLPRATWAHVESGAANPTLAVMHKVATALQVSLEELVSAPRANAKYYPRDELRSVARGQALIRKLLPDKVPGMEIDRMEITAHGRMIGVPHTPGTREYLTCEVGTIELAASGEKFRLTMGDVVVFRGDQPHSYRNVGDVAAVAYSVIAMARA
jgi:transcriptional regulator with XRE-family HTH domain